MSVAVKQPTEIEAKFAVVDPSVLETLARERSPVAGYRFGPVARKVVRDVYLDTADYRLLRHGYQVRVRTGIDGSVMTLKGSGAANEVGIYQRVEIEESFGGEQLPESIADMPPSLAGALGGVLDARAKLAPICVIEQTRRVRDIAAEAPGRTRGRAPTLAILSLDEMRIRQSREGAVIARAYEVEVELKPGVDAAELHVLADRFLGAFELTPSTESKLARSLAIISRHPLASPENWQGVQPSMHMAEACRVIWQEQFMQMLLNEAGVRHASDPEHVHDARVAIRRARAAARIHEEYFKPKATRRYLKRLRRTARLLGAVRDLDVAIGKLQEYRQKNRRKWTGDLQAKLDEWLAKRASAHGELVAWLDNKKYAAFVADFVRFCRTPGAGIVHFESKPGDEVTPFQVRHVTPTMLLSNFERVRSFETCFEQADAVPVETLHRLRIACKYLRYNLEFVANLLGPQAGEIIESLRNLQDDLGDLNDAAVSKQLLAGGESVDGEAATTSYERTQDRIIEKLRRQMRRDFAGFVSPANRARIFSAIANL
ncbi:MAG: CHAD domain-containing protein [Caldilinea sp.]|nr:CHAD domain-containing protein [Caldilinea sp.]